MVNFPMETATSEANMGYNEVSEHGTVEGGPDAPDHPADGGREQMAKPQRTTASPAFQFYPRDFLLSKKVIGMSATERGVYITLLCIQWLDGNIPIDFEELAPLVKVKPSQLARMWPRHLARCFTIRDGFQVNERLERVRNEQAAYRRKQAEKGRIGGAAAKHRLSNRKATAKQLPSSITTTTSVPESVESNKQIEVSGALRFVTVGEPDSWSLPTDRVTSWQSSYPNLDVMGECRKASAWLDANPARRKTASGMPRFLVNWLNNAVNRGGRSLHLAATGTEGRGRTGAPPKGKYDGIEEQD